MLLEQSIPGNIYDLDIFTFYNKTSNFIENDKLEELKKELKTKKIVFYTNEEYLKNDIVFFLFQVKNDIKIGLLTEYDSNMKLKDIKDIWGNKVFTFDLTDEQENFLIDIFDSGKFGYFEIYDNWEMCLYDCFTHHKKDFYKSDMGKSNEMLGLSFFNYEIIGEFDYNSNLYLIEDVKEGRVDNKNYRLFLISNLQTKYSSYEMIFENEKNYNLIDKGRLFIEKERKRIFYSELANSGDEIDRDVFKLIRQNISEILSEQENVFNKQIYRFYNNQVKRHYIGRYKATDKEQEIINKYLDLLEKGKEIKIKQILVTKDCIKTEDGAYSISFNEDFLDLKNNFYEIKQAIDKSGNLFDFNIIYEHCLRLTTLNRIRNDYKVATYYAKFNVNGIDIVINKDGNRLYVNNIFVRKEDVYEIIKKAVCYNNLTDFNNYIKDVSYIGLELKHLINNGIIIKLYSPFNDAFCKKLGKNADRQVLLRFSLLWDMNKRSKIYILLNGVKYLIKSKPWFKKEFDFPEKSFDIGMLKHKLSTCLEKFDETVFLEILENGIKESVIIKKRGEQLLNETIATTKAKRTEVNIGGKLYKGYEVIGIKTKRQYFIEELDLNVYRLDNGIWNRRCVVSDPNKQRIWEDRIANRLVNIYNENSRINTLFN